MIWVCPHCSQDVTAADSAAVGSAVNCPGCGQPFSLGVADPVVIQVQTSLPTISRGTTSRYTKRKKQSPLSWIIGGGFVMLVVCCVLFGLLNEGQNPGTKEQQAIEAVNRAGEHIVDVGDEASLDKAIAELTKAIQLDPKCAKAYFARSLAYGFKAKFQKAKADCQKAHDLGYPGCQSIMNTLVTEEKLWGEDFKNEAEVIRKMDEGINPYTDKPFKPFFSQ